MVGIGYGRPHRAANRFEHSDFNALVDCLASRTLPSPCVSIPLTKPKRHSFLRVLGDFCKVRIGCVTGDAHFFLLTETQRKTLRIPLTSVVPILTKARQLLSANIHEKTWTRLRDSSERVWLFSPNKKSMKSRWVTRYLALKPAQGGCDREAWKVKSRKPWYEVPLPSQTDGFLSGMSKTGPWLCLNSMSRLVASNTLYVASFVRGLSVAQRAALGLCMLSTQGRQHFKKVGRVYADGLIKYEPSDLAATPVIEPRRCSGALKVYKRAVELVLQGREAEASEIADAWIDIEKRICNALQVPPIGDVVVTRDPAYQRKGPQSATSGELALRRENMGSIQLSTNVCNSVPRQL